MDLKRRNQMETLQTVVTETTPEVQAQETKTFTQDQLDAVVKDRLARERDKFARELGIDESFSKEKYDEFRKFQEAQKTELEKAKEQATKLEAEKLELLTERERLSEEYAAAKLGIKPEALQDALALAKIKDGNSIEDKLGKVLEDYPIFAMNNTNAAPKSIGSEKKDERPSTSQADTWLAKKGLNK
jgi:hypothetical protein